MASIKAQNTRFFQPTAIAGCQVWFDGADPLGTGIAPANSASISTWTDKSVNGFNATPSSGRIAGTFSSASNCVYFGSSSVGYQTSYSANPTNETMFIVANINSPANINNNTIIGGQYGARSFGFGYSGAGGSGSSSYLNNEVAWQNSSVTGPPTGTTSLITGTVTTTTSVAVALNGSSFTTGSIPAWSSGTTTYLGVDTTTTAYYYVGFVMEIIFYNSVLSDTQRKQIEGYLAWKWGIQNSLPNTHTFYRNVYFAEAVYYPKAAIKTTGTNLNHPLAIAGLSLWFDGQDILGTGAPFPIGGTVTTWVDKSPFANSTTSRAGSSTYIGGGLGAYPAPYFLAAASPIYFLGGFSQTFTGTQMNCFAVASLASGSYSAWGRILGLSRPGVNDFGDNTVTFPFIQNNATQALIISRNASYLSTPLPAYGTPFVVQSSHNGPMEYIGINGNLTPASSNTGISASFNITSYGLGTNPNTADTGSYWTGCIGEVITFFGTVLPTSQLQLIEGYLAWKWGIQASLATGHPYQTVPPTFTPYRNPIVRNNFNMFLSPTSIGGCRLWLDASDRSSITLSGVNMTQWNDKSGLTNNMTPYSTFSNVTISSNYQNNLNVLNFSGAGVYQAPASSGVYPVDLYIVMALKDLTTHVDVVGVTATGATDNFNALGFSEYQTSRWYNGSTGFYRTPNTLSTSNETSTSFLLMNWSIANSNYILRRNGVQLTQTASYTWTPTAGYVFQVGFRVSPALYSPATTAGPYRGYIAEIVAFNSQLATTQQQQIEGYLAWKWGLKNSLPTTHPYYNFPPSP